MTFPDKLTDAQISILSAASHRTDHCLVAPPNLKGGAAHKVAAKLLAVGLVREFQTKIGMAPWRSDKETGQAYSLKLTAAGLKAIAIYGHDSQPGPSADLTSNVNDDAPKAKAAASTPAPPSATAASRAAVPRQGTKIARVIELLQRDEGAKLEELISATGWLPHTARAALTGLRHRGNDIRLERGETGRASGYRAVETLATGS